MGYSLIWSSSGGARGFILQDSELGWLELESQARTGGHRGHDLGGTLHGAPRGEYELESVLGASLACELLLNK